MSTPLTPEILNLVAADRLDRPAARRLTSAHVQALIAVARDPRIFPESVSAVRAIQALGRGAGPGVSIPVLEAILRDQAAPTTHRVAAARELGGIATPEAELVLLRCVGSGNLRAEEAVLTALGQFAGPKALRELAKLTDVGDQGVHRRLTLTRALIAHREGLDGPFLPEATGKMRKAEEIQVKVPLTLRWTTEGTTASDRRILNGSSYGIDLAPAAAALQCGRNEWTVFFNSGLGAATLAKRLFERPWIAALLGRWYVRGKAIVTQHLVLTRPVGRGARIDVVRTDGEIMYTGAAVANGPALSFSISDVGRPGTAPATVTGRMSSSSIELDDAVASGRRLAPRSTAPVVVV